MKDDMSNVMVRLNTLEKGYASLKAEIEKIKEISKDDLDIIKRYYSREQYEKMLTSHEFKKNRIVGFLKDNKDKAYTPTELSRSLNMKKQKVTRALRHLIIDGVIRHKSPYYIINEKEVVKNE